jgi:hypothetical protein
VNTNDEPQHGGWGYPAGTLARKAHYFPRPGERSLCRKYGSFMTTLREREPVLDVDCAECVRKRAKRATP